MDLLEDIHLQRGVEQSDQIQDLGRRFGRPVGLTGVLDGLNRTATRARVPGRAPVWGLTWNAQDLSSRRWWPQGISTTADASDTGEVLGHRLLVTSWYSHGGEGSRVTFLDLQTLRYRHVLLVRAVPDSTAGARLEPLVVHAGGVVWVGDHLYVAGTRRGLFVCRVADIIRLEPRDGSFDYRYVLPVRFAYRAHAAEQAQGLRYSFVSLHRSAGPPELVVGEYGRDQMSTRIARYGLEPGSMLLDTGPDGRARPVDLDRGGVARMQGAVMVGDRYYVTVSRGTHRKGHLYAGRPGGLRPYRWALPPGPEDLCYWPSTDRLWSLSEHPGQRFVFAMDRARFA